ncbi:MAG: HAMP domain-containing histidine kinase, partial [Sphingobacteriales bacterium]
MSKFKFREDYVKTNFWQGLIGSHAQFPLERRIFHSIAIGITVLLSVYVPYNLVAGLLVASLSALVIALFFSHQYYYSRFHNKPHNNRVFGLVGVVVLGFNYFTNSGIHGSTDIIWPAYLLLVFAITPYQQHLTWLVIYLLCFIILHIIEFQYPALVQHPFSAGKGQFLDRITAFPIPVVGIYIIMTFIRRNYDKEKKITEEKTLVAEISKAQLLVQKDKLEEINIEKNKLMSIISHDLRTPLINIQNYLNLLVESGIESDERPKLEQGLLKSTNSAMEMLSNLLHWSKSQMTGANVQLREVNLLNCLQNTLDIEHIHASKKDILLKYNIATHLTLIADADMLQLVVRNLINNAIKFTPKGGSVGLYVKQI